MAYPAVSKDDYPDFNNVERKAISQLQGRLAYLKTKIQHKANVKEIAALEWAFKTVVSNRSNSAPEPLDLAHIETLERRVEYMGTVQSKETIFLEEWSRTVWLVKTLKEECIS